MLRNQKLLLILSLVLAQGCSGCNQPKSTVANTEWFIVVAGPKETLIGAAEQFQALVGSISAPGDVVHVITAPSHRPAATFEVPHGDYASRLRHPSIRGELSKLKPVFMPDQADVSAQLQVPEFSATLQSLRQTGFGCRIVLVGDPIYDTVRHQGVSMTGGVIPTDGYLDEIPFRGGNLPDETIVTWLTPTAEWGEDSVHREAVTRFYPLFFQERGATLVRVTADAATAFRSDHPHNIARVVRRDEQPAMDVVSHATVRSEAGAGTLSEDGANYQNWE